MFKGSYRYKIDPKGRLPVPAPFRRGLSEAGATTVVVTLLDQCLGAYPPDEWRRLEDQLRALPAFGKTARALTRLLTSRAVDCALDVQGRILLPSALRKAVDLGPEAVVVGVLNRFEVWPPQVWETFLQESERLLDDVSLEIPWPLPPSTPAREGGELGHARPHPQGKPSR